MLPKIYQSLSELKGSLNTIVSDADGDLTIGNQEALINSIDDLAYTSALSDDQSVREYTQNLIRKLAHIAGCPPSSIHNLYMAFGRGEIQGFTVPAMNIRMLTYDICQRAFKLALQHNIGAMIFELANSEQEYTHQPASEYSASVLAAAIKVGFKGPVFIQGDHYQFKVDKFLSDKEKEIQRMKEMIDRTIKAEFYNIDIDGSTLVDLKQTSINDQQRNNYEMTALMAEYIRSNEPKGMTISIGGEIGHIGGINSTVQDFEAFMDGLQTQGNYKNLTGISKVSVQTGTSHGGVVMPDGTLKQVSVDFNVLKDISAVGRQKYHMGGSVQHGASTLPEDLFDHFPENNALEIHLATGFQNIFFDNAPDEIKQKMFTWVKENLKNEKEKDQTEDQFVYTLRKKAHGPFKKEQWLLDDDAKKQILDALDTKFELLFKKLNVLNTADTVKKYV